MAHDPVVGSRQHVSTRSRRATSAIKSQPNHQTTDPCCAGALADLSWVCTNAAALVAAHKPEETIMAWTTPTLVEICIGLEINGYLPAEF